MEMHISRQQEEITIRCLVHLIGNVFYPLPHENVNFHEGWAGFGRHTILRPGIQRDPVEFLKILKTY